MKIGTENDIAPVYIEGDIIPYFVIAKDSAEGVIRPDGSKESMLWAKSDTEANTKRHVMVHVISFFIRTELVILLVCYVVLSKRRMQIKFAICLYLGKTLTLGTSCFVEQAIDKRGQKSIFVIPERITTEITLTTFHIRPDSGRRSQPQAFEVIVTVGEFPHTCLVGFFCQTIKTDMRFDRLF